jgi:4-amino-4-deoxy-L-arabinose transferase-like glycosyltransferase
VRRHWPLLPIAALALALRLVNLDYGLPGHPHPDEWRVVRPAARMARAAELDLHPGFFNYPALQMVLLGASLRVADAFSPPAPGEPFREVAVRDLRVARRVTAAFGLATVLVTYALGLLVGGRTTAVLAALFLAVAPYHALDSHYTNVDVPMTLWLVAAAGAALVFARRRRRGWLLAAGACLGLATATKYTALAAAPLLPAACLAARRAGEGLWRSLAPAVPALALMLVFFAAGAPYTFLDFEGFRAGLQEEQVHMGEGHVGFDLAPRGWIYRRGVHQLAAGLPFALGVPLYLLALGGLAGLARRPRAPGLVLAAAVLPVFALLVVPEVVFLRYLLPLLPFLAVAAAGFTAWALGRGRRAAWLGGTALAATLLYTTAFTASQLRSLEPQNGALASDWIREHVPPGPVAIAGLPWMLNLPGGAHTLRRFKLERARKRHHLPEWLVVSGWYERAYQRGSLRRGPEGRFLGSLERPGSTYELRVRFACHYLDQELYARLDPSFAHQFACLDFAIYRLREPDALTGRAGSGHAGGT